MDITKTSTPTPAAIAWVPYSPQAFARAKSENKLIILDLEAVWCHWCHVQDEMTYMDPEVTRLIGDHYIAIKVDQDSRPDISNRYEDYGWPATIIFDSQGHEIVKRRGYLPPEEMRAVLGACVADPTPGPSVQPQHSVAPATNPTLADAYASQLRETVVDAYDPSQGGWGRGYKFIDADLIEYCSDRAMAGDGEAARMAKQTMTAGLKLIDPVWGGVYQYSTDGLWDHSHFEKIMSYQADDLRTFARSYAVWHDKAYYEAAETIHRFLRTFLTSPDGAFYTSQDADQTPGVHGGDYFALNDAARRAKGVPRVDQHIYARENGWAIRALVDLHAYAGDAAALEEAKTAAEWIVVHRRLEGGGFTHGESDPAGPYLGDTVAMGRAFSALYASTADKTWLSHANDAATFIQTHFVPTDQKHRPGVMTRVDSADEEFLPTANVDENVAVARFARLLFAYTGDAKQQALAETAARFLAAPEVAEHRGYLVGGLLLVNQDLSTDPLHVTVVGRADDMSAQALFNAANQTPVDYRRVELYDRRQGTSQRDDVSFPDLPTAAAFLCTGNACSSPIKSVEALRKALDASANKAR